MRYELKVTKNTNPHNPYVWSFSARKNFGNNEGVCQQGDTIKEIKEKIIARFRRYKNDYDSILERHPHMHEHPSENNIEVVSEHPDITIHWLMRSIRGESTLLNYGGAQ